MSHKLNPNRRIMIQSLLAISAMGVLSACRARPEGDSASSSAISLDYASEGNFFDANELAFISALGNIIIPKTDTPGAGEADIVSTIQLLVSDWADDDFKRYWRGGLSHLSHELNGRGGKDFMQLTAKQSETLLTKYDQDVFAGRIKNKFYKDMKSTIATAYYMSEAGATEELIYEPVPGDWVGEVPFSKIGKTWAT